MSRKHEDRAQANLQKQAEAAQTLMVHLRSLAADDEETVHDTIEGETGFFEAVAEAVKSIRDDEAYIEALKGLEGSYEARRKRLEGRKEAKRAALQVALSTAEQPSVETPFGTVSKKVVPPSLVVTDEAAISSKYWKTGDPKLDKKALLADLRALPAGESIEGATLSNGGESISISKV